MIPENDALILGIFMDQPTTHCHPYNRVIIVQHETQSETTFLEYDPND